MKRTILLVCLLLSVASAGVVNFNYEYNAVRTLNWNNASIWDTNTIPTADDEVYIVGGDYASNGITTITITAPVTVKSLHYEANDVRIASSSSVTTPSFTLKNFGYITGGAIIITGASTLTFSSSSSYFNRVQFNVTQTGTVTSTGTLYSPDTTFNSYGTWTLLGDSMLGKTDVTTKSFVFNNYGTLKVTASSTSYNENAISGKVNNYGTITIDADAEFELGQTSDSANSNTFTSFSGSSVVTNGKFTIYDSSSAVLNIGSSFTGTGEIYLLGYGPWATLTINIAAVTFGGKFTLEGSGQVIGTSVLTIGTISWMKGARITGSGSITADNVELSANVYGSGGASVLSGRNLTATTTFSQAIPNLAFGNKAFIILTSTCQSILTTGVFDQVASDTSSTGLINYGAISARPSTKAYFTCNIPLYNHGSINSPNAGESSDPAYYSGPAGMYFQGGGSHTGDLIVNEFKDYTDFYGFATNYGTVGLYGYNIMESTSTHHGGFRLFENNGGGCSDYTSTKCYATGLTSWRGRTSTTGNGVIVSHQGTTFSIDGPGVVFERYGVIGGQITGNYNLTVQKLRRVNAGYDAKFVINGTNLIITDTLELENGGKLNFVKHGKLIVLPQATLNFYSDLGGQVSNDDEGLYNFGTAHIKIDQGSTFYFMGSSFINYGTIILDTNIDYESQPKGAQLNVYNGGSFTPGRSGTIRLNVYSKTDSDSISFFPGTACTYGGTLNFNFQYTPKAGDTIYIGAAQVSGAPPCQGNFTIKTTNLPTSLQAVIMYDFEARDGSSSVENFLVVCASSNNTCTNYKRPVAASTTGTETTTGTAPTTGTASTTKTATTTGNGNNSGNNSGSESGNEEDSSASVVSSFFVLVIVSLFLAML